MAKGGYLPSVSSSFDSKGGDRGEGGGWLVRMTKGDGLSSVSVWINLRVCKGWKTRGGFEVVQHPTGVAERGWFGANEPTT